eukprot:14078355-Ditylum_brightwellii.AAC.1
MYFCPVFVFKRICFTALQIFALSCAAITCVDPTLPDNLVPKTTALHYDSANFSACVSFNDVED